MIPRREEAVVSAPSSPALSSDFFFSDSDDEAELLGQDYAEAGKREEGGRGDGTSAGAGGSGGGSERGLVRAKWRHALGIALLLLTVVLWTVSNFLASTIFADSSYSKPYFVTYINTSFFLLPLIPILIHHYLTNPGVSLRTILHTPTGKWSLTTSTPLTSEPTESPDSTSTALLTPDTKNTATTLSPTPRNQMLTPLTTLKHALEFAALWFTANYFAAACLSHTTVASSTILSSTSSLWTLGLGALMRVELITARKALGVLLSLLGVVLVSTIDISGNAAAGDNTGSFPDKSAAELALGDAMAFVSAAVYGVYAVFLKARIGCEDRVNMPLFFGCVGLANIVFAWPGLVVLHWTGVEPFLLPPDARIWAIVLGNSVSSLVADFAWAWAMLLTGPLVVTVGLSLTIPLSLVGQMVIEGMYASVLYWIGAAVMVGSFFVVNVDENKDKGVRGRDGADGRGEWRELRSEV